MSARSDERGDFLRWLLLHGHRVSGDDFVPRALFGEYMRDLLTQTRAPLLRFTVQATSLARERDGLRIGLEDGRWLVASTVVLAVGMLSPALPRSLRAVARRAWDPGALEGIPGDAPVLLLGSGLTTVDVALALARRGHRGSMHVLSRHGLLPAPHAAGPGVPARFEPRSAHLRELLRAVRLEVRAVERAGGDWRTVIDALRPLSPTIWASLSLEDRRRFLRHVRAYWDVHRHRMAPESARELYALMRTGKLRVHGGTVEQAIVGKRGVAVRWRTRGTEERHEVNVNRVLDCATASGLVRAESTLLRSAEAAGLVRLDPLGLGIETASVGAAVGRHGVSTDLFAVGALRRFERWESRAISELRDQAAALATCLAHRLRASGPLLYPIA